MESKNKKWTKYTACFFPCFIDNSLYAALSFWFVSMTKRRLKDIEQNAWTLKTSNNKPTVI